MKMKVRDILDALPGPRLKRLLSRRGLSTNGRVDAQRSTLARSIAGDFDWLIGELTADDMRLALHFDFEEAGVAFTFENYSNATKPDLAAAVKRVYATDWTPTQNTKIGAINVVVLEDDDDPHWDEHDDDDVEHHESVDEPAWHRSPVLTGGPDQDCPPPLVRKTLQLHAHQTRSLSKLRAWWKNEKQSGMLVLPTGSGKTRTAAAFALSHVLPAKQVLWLTHRTELVNQAVATLLENGADATQRFTVGRFQAGDLKTREEVDVLVASIPSLAWKKNHNVSRLRTLVPRLGLIVVDECHHAVARTWGNLLVALKKRYPGVKVLGLTATPVRTQDSEQDSLVRMFDENLVHAERVMDLVQARVLATPHLDIRPTGLKFKATEKDRKAFAAWSDIPPALMKTIESDSKRNEMMLGKLVSNIDKYGQVLVFASSIAHAERFQASIPSSIPSRLVTGRTSGGERQAAIDAFRARSIRVLVNVDILTEGTDVPGVDTVFIARPVTSPVLFRQMVGRGMRGPEMGGSAHCNIVGFRDEIAELMDDHLTTVQTFVSDSDGLDAIGLDEPVLQELKAVAPPRKEVKVKPWTVLLGAVSESRPLVGWWSVETDESIVCLPVFSGDENARQELLVRLFGGSDIHDTSTSAQQFADAFKRRTALPKYTQLANASADDAALVREQLPKLPEAPPPPQAPPAPAAVQPAVASIQSAAADAPATRAAPANRIVGIVLVVLAALVSLWWVLK